jgi:SAM-dependent methyltransferase
MEGMFTDVVDLRDFYAETVGQVTQRLLRARLRELWPDVRGLRVAGMGYAVPFLRPYMDEAERVLALMPAAQGVLPWPNERANLATLVDEIDLPLPDRSVDRLVVVHALECAEQIRPLLREAWRVLADGGRMIIVVPNRTGLWSQLDRSPFYHGHPYSARQLAALLRANMFTPLREARALYLPPTRSRLLLGVAPTVEKLGRRLFSRFAGVAIVEAGKQIYAGVVQQTVPARPRLRVAHSRDPSPAAGRLTSSPARVTD